MQIALGSDHGGYGLKSELIRHLRNAGHEVLDLGAHSRDSVDYPDYGTAVGRAAVGDDAEIGVAICGTGIGISIAANKVPGVRAAVVHDVTTARLAKEHNNANVICLGERVVAETTALAAVDAFLGATFEGGRHERRVNKIAQLDHR